ncbi:E3 ubiquitin-protein ligase trim71 [Chamberlinius hualienensis]
MDDALYDRDFLPGSIFDTVIAETIFPANRQVDSKSRFGVSKEDPPQCPDFSTPFDYGKLTFIISAVSPIRCVISSYRHSTPEYNKSPPSLPLTADDSVTLMDKLMPKAERILNSMLQNHYNTLNFDLSKLETEHLNSSANVPGIMCGCIDGNYVTSLCKDCNEGLCDQCVGAHQRVRLTRHHFIEPYVMPNTSPISQSNSRRTSPTVSVKSVSPRLKSSRVIYCKAHIKEVILYCVDCRFLMCSDCHINAHANHDLKYMQEAFGEAEKHARAIVSDITLAIQSIDHMMNLAQIRLEDAMQNAKTLDRTIDTHFLSYIEEYSKRKSNLLSELQKFKQSKEQTLRNLMTELNDNKDILQRYFQNLKCAIEVGDNVDIMRMNNEVGPHVNIIHKTRFCLKPSENHLSYSTAPMSDISEKANLLGRIKSGAYAPNCFVLGHSPHLAILNTDSSFKVQTKDHVSRELDEGGETIMTIFKGESQIIIVESSDLQNGTYLISFKLGFIGEYEVSVRIGGTHIKGSPFKLLVRHPRNYYALNGNPKGKVIASEGQDPGKVCRPWGVASDRLGRIVVADRSNNRIQVFSSEGDFLYLFGTRGIGDGEFDRPAGVAVNSEFRILVADKDNHRIQVFDFEGNFIFKFGERGALVGQFNYPWDVKTNSRDQIFVSDTRNRRIQMFSHEGTFIAKFGYEQQNWKLFDSPRGIAFDANDNVLVTDFNNHRIVLLDSKLKQSRTFGKEGSEIGQFLRPQSITTGPEGVMIISDSKNHRIQVFRSDGNFISQFGSYGQGENVGDDQMDRPSGICLTPQGIIVVVDFGNNRVMMF